MLLNLENHPQFTIVDNISSLLRKRFTAQSNVVLFRREKLQGDFDALASAIQGKDQSFQRFHLEDSEANEKLRSLGNGKKNAKIRKAIEQVLGDHAELQNAKEKLCLPGQLHTELRSIKTYAALPPSKIEKDLASEKGKELRRSNPDALAEMYNENAFHFDASGSKIFGRILAAYNEPTTEGVLNKDILIASRNAYLPKIRIKAETFRFRVFDIWRQAALGCQETVSPFAHRGTASEKPRCSLVVDLI